MNKMQQCQQILRNCAYQNIEQVNQACYSILNMYQGLSPQFKQQRDGNFTRNLIELIGDIEIQYKGNKFGIKTVIFFPFMYPTAPCVIKIINIDPSRFRVAEAYQQGIQSDGTINVYLSEYQNWAYHRDPIKLLRQLEVRLSQNFPFFAQKNQQNSNNGSNYSNQGQFNNNNMGGYNQQGSQPVNPLGNMGQFNKPPQFNQQPSNQSNSSNYQKLQQEASQQLAQVADKMTSDIKNLKTSLDQALDQKQEIESQEIKMQQIEQDLTGKSNEIVAEIQQLESFLQQNDNKTVNEDNITEFLVEQDPLSTQIIDLMAQNQSLSDCGVLIEGAFGKNLIDFQQLQTMIRDYGSKEFDNKMLLRKCIDMAQRQNA